MIWRRVFQRHGKPAELPDNQHTLSANGFIDLQHTLESPSDVAIWSRFGEGESGGFQQWFFGSSWPHDQSARLVRIGLSRGAIRQSTAAMRRANKYNSLHRRIGIEDERAFDERVLRHLGVK